MTARPGLRASPGDRLLIHGHQLGEPERDGEVLEAKGDDGGPPFLVRWEDDGRITTLYPSSDASIQHLAHERRDGRSARPSPPPGA
jgi:hypothetical protein